MGARWTNSKKHQATLLETIPFELKTPKVRPCICLINNCKSYDSRLLTKERKRRMTLILYNTRVFLHVLLQQCAENMMEQVISIQNTFKTIDVM